MSSADAAELVHLVRYLRNDHRPTARAMRLIAENRLTAQQRADGWWVRREELEDELRTVATPLQGGITRPMSMFIRTPEFPTEPEQLVNLAYVRAIEFIEHSDPEQARVIARFGDGTSDWAPLARGSTSLCKAAYKELCGWIARGSEGQLAEWPDFWKKLVERPASTEH